MASASSSRPRWEILERRVHGAVRGGDRTGIAGGLREIAEDRRRAMRLHLRRPFAVTHERVDPMAAAHERLQHRGAYATGSARQEYAHVWRLSNAG